jgi:hypothetical protein
VLINKYKTQQLKLINTFLFQKVKEILTGRHFDDIDDIRNNTTVALKAIPQYQFEIVLMSELDSGIGV